MVDRAGTKESTSVRNALANGLTIDELSVAIAGRTSPDASNFAEGAGNLFKCLSISLYIDSLSLSLSLFIYIYREREIHTHIVIIHLSLSLSPYIYIYMYTHMCSVSNIGGHRPPLPAPLRHPRRRGLPAGHTHAYIYIYI